MWTSLTLYSFASCLLVVYLLTPASYLHVWQNNMWLKCISVASSFTFFFPLRGPQWGQRWKVRPGGEQAQLSAMRGKCDGHPWPFKVAASPNLPPKHIWGSFWGRQVSAQERIPPWSFVFSYVDPQPPTPRGHGSTVWELKHCSHRRASTTPPEPASDVLQTFSLPSPRVETVTFNYHLSVVWRWGKMEYLKTHILINNQINKQIVNNATAIHTKSAVWRESKPGGERGDQTHGASAWPHLRGYRSAPLHPRTAEPRPQRTWLHKQD